MKNKKGKKKDKEIITPEVVYTPEHKPVKRAKKPENTHEKRNKKIKPVEKRKRKEVVKHKPTGEKPPAAVIRLPLMRFIETIAIAGILVYLLGEVALFVLLLLILYVMYNVLWGRIEWI